MVLITKKGEKIGSKGLTSGKTKGGLKSGLKIGYPKCPYHIQALNQRCGLKMHPKTSSRMNILSLICSHKELEQKVCSKAQNSLRCQIALRLVHSQSTIIEILREISKKNTMYAYLLHAS